MKIIQRSFTLIFLVVLLVSTPISAQNNNISLERTYQVKDIETGPGTSFPINFVELKEKVYFKADVPLFGEEIWYSDGTEEGTNILKDIRPGPEGRIWELKVFNSKLYISVDDGIHGTELWQSDGTEAGTHMLKDINPNGSSNPSFFLVANNFMFFQASDASGTFLWRTDGTQAGTMKVIADLKYETSRCGLYGIEFQEKLYFSTSIQNNAGWTECRLFQTNGSPENFEQVGYRDAISPHIHDPHSFVVVGNLLFFSAISDTPGLWIVDSNGKAQFVKDVGIDYSADAVSFQGLLFFTGIENGEDYAKLWRSDGTPQGTYSISPAIGQPTYYAPADLTVYGNILLFNAYSLENEYELFKSNGQQVELVKDIVVDKCHDLSYHCGSNPSDFTVINGKVLFRANSRVSDPTDNEIWITDGTADGTRKVADICPGDCSSEPAYFYRLENRVFFTADDGQSGRELWAYEPSLQWLYLPAISR